MHSILLPSPERTETCLFLFLPLFKSALSPLSFLFLFLSLYILPLFLSCSDLLSVSLPVFDFSQGVWKSHGHLHCNKEQTVFYLCVAKKGWKFSVMTSGSWEGEEHLVGSPGRPPASAPLNGLAVSLPHLSNSFQEVGRFPCNKSPYCPQLLLYEETQRFLRWRLTLCRGLGRCLVKNEYCFPGSAFPVLAFGSVIVDTTYIKLRASVCSAEYNFRITRWRENLTIYFPN